MVSETNPPAHQSLLELKALQARPARSRDELESAYRLVYDSYRTRDYIPESESGMRLSVFNCFPGTVTFVSVFRSDVISTITLVEDTPAGLPMDAIYSDELRPLRRAGRKVAEATMFADRRQSDYRRTLPMLLLLMKRVFDYCVLVAAIDDICITINPRHEMFYEKRLIFEPLGGLKSYPSVQDAPALAKRLNLHTSEERAREHKQLWQLFYEDRTDPAMLERRFRFDCEDLRYFLVESTTVLREAAPEKVAALQESYPGCPWENWLRG